MRCAGSAASTDSTLEPIVPAVEQWRYRNKLEYSFGTDDGGRLVCGFHAPGRWEEIVEVTDCLLASERGNAARERVVAWCRAQGLEPMTAAPGEGLLRNLVVREGRRTGELQVRLVTAPGSSTARGSPRPPQRLDGLLWTRIDSVAEATQGGETELLAGARPPRGGARRAAVRLPEAFFQTNTEMAERLYGLAIEYAQPTGFERVYDLYCGIGTIGLLMAPRVGRGLGPRDRRRGDRRRDRQRAAQRDRQRPLLRRRRALALRELVERAGRPDLLVVDPPRSGLSQKTSTNHQSNSSTHIQPTTPMFCPGTPRPTHL